MLWKILRMLRVAQSDSNEDLKILKFFKYQSKG